MSKPYLANLLNCPFCHKSFRQNIQSSHMDSMAVLYSTTAATRIVMARTSASSPNSTLAERKPVNGSSMP
jgi:hypothetical protein